MVLSQMGVPLLDANTHGAGGRVAAQYARKIASSRWRSSCFG